MSLLTVAGQDMRVVVPGYGDMTAEVAIELAKLRVAENHRDAALAARRQAHIAKTCGTEAPLLDHGQLRAQIDGSVFSDWEKREGRGFFGDKSSLNDFLKRFPECRVRGIPKNPTFRVADTSGIILNAGKTYAPRRGGRWASAA